MLNVPQQARGGGGALASFAAHARDTFDPPCPSNTAKKPWPGIPSSSTATCASSMEDLHGIAMDVFNAMPFTRSADAKHV